MSAEEKWIGHRALALLRPGAFRRYIIGSAISDTGTWMQVMAQGWVMSTLTNKAILLGMANFAAGVPTLALTMIGGSAADRFDKRKILIATQIAQIAFAIGLGWLVLTNRIQIWHIIFFAALLGISIAFEMPAISALVPELVRRDEIAAAVAMDRSVFHGSRLVGPSFAGLCEEEQRRSGIMEGFRYVRSNRTILSMIALIACTTIFIFPTISVMLPLYVRNVLQLGPRELGWLMAVSGTGAFAGSLGLLTIPREKRLWFMTGNVLAIALGVFFMSRSHSFLLTACSMGTLAIALSINFGLANTIVQEHAPPELRGRVSAVFGLSFFGLMPIAGLVVTGFSDLIGMRTALTTASAIYAVAAFSVLSLAGRHVCDRPVSPAPEPELTSVA